MKKIFILAACLLSLPIVGMATPSTQVWNPSTDIQATKTLHLGIDNYYSVKGNAALSTTTAMPTDIGLTYGLLENLEVGIDLFYPQKNPVMFNVKYGLPEKDALPAVAVGVANVGTKKRPYRL